MIDVLSIYDYIIDNVLSCRNGLGWFVVIRNYERLISCVGRSCAGCFGFGCF